MTVTETELAPPETVAVEGLQIPVQEQTPPAPPADLPPTQTDTAPPNPDQPEQQPEPAPILETAFIVYMNPQGHWMVAQNIHEAAEMQIMRQPGVDDFFNGCSTVLRDIAVQETAATAVAMQQQALQSMAEQARQAQMNAEIAKFTGQGGAPAGAIDLSTLGRGRPGA